MRVVAFFNNAVGIGKTALVSHLAWMLADRGVSVLAVDFDPQAGLTSALLPEARIGARWSAGRSVAAALSSSAEGREPAADSAVESVADRFHLLVGDPLLAASDAVLAEGWERWRHGDAAAVASIAAPRRLIADAIGGCDASLALIDLGPGLGALNRSALMAADDVVIPVTPDLFSVRGMESLGPTLHGWRRAWRERVDASGGAAAGLPAEGLKLSGYVVTRAGAREYRTAAVDQTWAARMPASFRTFVLDQPADPSIALATDPFCLAAFKHYGSLMPLAVAARKPMFHLRPSDGARGAHLDAVRACHEEFLALARKLGAAAGVDIP